MEYVFRPVSGEDYALLHRWHNLPYVADNWDGPQSFEQVAQHQAEKMRSPKDFACIVLGDGRPIGYIQCGDYYQSGGGWWPDEAPGTWGIDTFIGEEDCLDRGHGSAYVRQFVDRLFRTDGVRKVIVDPRPGNARAIRAYEKAGFRIVKPIVTPDGDALYMERTKEPAQ
jgi:aminoglycoside 6'-N-acetyltransferase